MIFKEKKFLLLYMVISVACLVFFYKLYAMNDNNNNDEATKFITIKASDTNETVDLPIKEAKTFPFIDSILSEEESPLIEIDSHNTSLKSFFEFARLSLQGKQTKQNIFKSLGSFLKIADYFKHTELIKNIVNNYILVVLEWIIGDMTKKTSALQNPNRWNIIEQIGLHDVPNHIFKEFVVPKLLKKYTQELHHLLQQYFNSSLFLLKNDLNRDYATLHAYDNSKAALFLMNESNDLYRILIVDVVSHQIMNNINLHDVLAFPEEWQDFVFQNTILLTYKYGGDYDSLESVFIYDTENKQKYTVEISTITDIIQSEIKKEGMYLIEKSKNILYKKEYKEKLPFIMNYYKNEYQFLNTNKPEGYIIGTFNIKTNKIEYYFTLASQIEDENDEKYELKNIEFLPNTKFCIAQYESPKYGIYRLEEKKNQIIEIWDIEQQKNIVSISGNIASIEKMIFSDDDTLLAMFTHDNHVWLWDVKINQKIGQFVADHRLSHFFTEKNNLLEYELHNNVLMLHNLYPHSLPELKLSLHQGYFDRTVYLGNNLFACLVEHKKDEQKDLVDYFIGLVDLNLYQKVFSLDSYEQIVMLVLLSNYYRYVEQIEEGLKRPKKFKKIPDLTDEKYKDLKIMYDSFDQSIKDMFEKLK